MLGLVGKGITFDTGGISIKPADGMERMKVDMAGGAAVIGALRAAALLEAPIRVIGVVPTTENMPGGRAIKPGDVIRGASGKTVEVINTDAEGRLILGDGLWQARQLGATHLVDVATLTGACVVALGRVHGRASSAGPTRSSRACARVGERTGDRCWPMPSADEYFEQLKSEVADMTNTGGRPAGAVTAAVFLKQFAGGLPWAHLDIAGVAWADDARPYQAKGATGAATRLLAELALEPQTTGCKLDPWRRPPRPSSFASSVPPTDEVTLGDVLINALGLTGAITVTAMVLGIVLGGLFILYRRRHPHNQFNGETSDEMSLKLGVSQS